MTCHFQGDTFGKYMTAKAPTKPMILAAIRIIGIDLELTRIAAIS